MSPFRTVVGPIVLSFALATAVAAPARAAGTVLGHTFVPNTAASCTGAPDFEAFEPGQSSPTAGVITSWSFEPGVQPTTLALRVFRATATPGTYLVVTDGGPLQSVAAGSGLHTFPTRVPIQAGDLVGLHATAGTCSSNNVPGAGVLRSRSGALTPVGATASYDTSPVDGIALDVSAMLEPDADGDGYGDLTQDLCPGSASTQASCTGPGTVPGTPGTPDTTITNKTKNPHAKTVKLTFTSTVAGSTFTCTLDKKKAQPCLSPAKFVCLKPGKHTFSVVATDPQGHPDPTPATAKIKVKAPRKGC